MQFAAFFREGDTSCLFMVIGGMAHKNRYSPYSYFFSFIREPTNLW